MEKLTNIIEAIIFASGNAIETDDIREKLGITKRELDACIAKLEKKYTGDCGIHLLNFNHKLQFATNPEFKEPVSAVITPIREREFSRTILECAAIIAYKQPITRAELEDIRGGVSSDYAMSTLLSLEMIYPSGRRSTAGQPYEYSTTDNFLKRFKLKSLKDLPDYDELLKKITELNAQQSTSTYLYEKDVYVGEDETESEDQAPAQSEAGTSFAVPEFLQDEDDIVTIE